VVYLFDKFVLDTARRELRCGSEPRAVEPQVFDVLEYLIRNRDRVVSKDDLLAAVWNGRVVSDATLASRINAARGAIGDNGEEQRAIRTFPRKGMRFVCEVQERDERDPGAAQSSGGILPLPDKPSIAVLPFQNMSVEAEQEYFVDGVVEEIISGLSRIKWLFVIARNSSFVYKGRVADIKQVGRELGVRYVLEGSLRKAGNRIRMSAQLVEAETGRHVWSQRYDGSLDDIFAVQDEITLSVIGAIEPSLRKAEIERVNRKRPDSLDAYDLLLRALPFLYSAMPAGVANAIPLLEKALELDPNYARAHADLAWCLHHRFSRSERHNDEDRKAAVRHARAAVAGAGDDSTALAIAAFVISFDAHDNATALDLYDRALALSGSNIFALGCSAVTLAWMGTNELAIERAQRALRFSPFDPLNVRPHCATAIAQFNVGQFEEAASAARRAIEFNPGFSIPHALLAAALARTTHTDEARAAARRVLALEPSFTVRGLGLTAGFTPAIYSRFADAWALAGLPEG
jgi:TolB-like protein